MKDKDKLMCTNEVCRYLKISLRTLYRMIQQGRLPAIKVGHQWRFRFGEISKFLVNRALTRPRYFKHEVLKQYLDYPEKYEVKKDTQGGWLGLQPAYVTELIKQGKRKEVFARIRFHRVKIKTGGFLLMILPNDFNQLPNYEQRGWVYYQSESVISNLTDSILLFLYGYDREKLYLCQEKYPDFLRISFQSHLSRLGGMVFTFLDNSSSVSFQHP